MGHTVYELYLDVLLYVCLFLSTCLKSPSYCYAIWERFLKKKNETMYRHFIILFTCIFVEIDVQISPVFTMCDWEKYIPMSETLNLCLLLHYCRSHVFKNSVTHLQKVKRSWGVSWNEISSVQREVILYKPLFSRFWTRCGNSRVVNFAIFLMLSLLYKIDMNWSGNFREGLARENKTLAKITAYTVGHDEKLWNY